MIERLLAAAHSSDDRAGHVLICPPPSQPALQRLAVGLRRWFEHGLAVAPSARSRRVESPAVLTARHDFIAALDDIPGEAAARLVHRVHATTALRELWHLRVDVFALIARQHGERAADARLARLNRHFPTRSPRSGFGGLDGPPR